MKISSSFTPSGLTCTKHGKNVGAGFESCMQCLTALPREQPQSQTNNLHFDDSRCARRGKSETFGLIWMPLCLVGVEGERNFSGLYKLD